MPPLQRRSCHGICQRHSWWWKTTASQGRPSQWGALWFHLLLTPSGCPVLHCTSHSHMWGISVSYQHVRLQPMMWNLRFSQQWLWTVLLYGCNGCKSQSRFQMNVPLCHNMFLDFSHPIKILPHLHKPSNKSAWSRRQSQMIFLDYTALHLGQENFHQLNKLHTNITEKFQSSIPIFNGIQHLLDTFFNFSIFILFMVYVTMFSVPQSLCAEW